VGARVGGARCARGPVGWDEMQGEGTGMGGWEIGEGVGWAARGFGDNLDAGLPVAKSAPNPYTTQTQLCQLGAAGARVRRHPVVNQGALRTRD
jgi:hypothetical protein